MKEADIGLYEWGAWNNLIEDNNRLTNSLNEVRRLFDLDLEYRLRELSDD